MLTPLELAALRQDYAQRGLRRSDLDPDPIRQFNTWLAEAHAQQLLEPNAMTLATVDAAGQPWTRTVLLKVCDPRGFTFFTNYDGAKARHLAAEPRAALTFWWGPLERQVNITGTVAPVSREESDAYFRTRPIASRLGAWASAQSEIIADRAALEAEFAAAGARFGEEEIPLPPHWGGYCLTPATIEFWQGRRSRLHDRLRYTRQETRAAIDPPNGPLGNPSNIPLRDPNDGSLGSPFNTPSGASVESQSERQAGHQSESPAAMSPWKVERLSP